MEIKNKIMLRKKFRENREWDLRVSLSMFGPGLYRGLKLGPQMLNKIHKSNPRDGIFLGMTRSSNYKATRCLATCY